MRKENLLCQSSVFNFLLPVSLDIHMLHNAKPVFPHTFENSFTKDYLVIVILKFPSSVKL